MTKRDDIPGVTDIDLGNGGRWVIANDYVDGLRAKGGDDAVLDHFNDMLYALGVKKGPARNLTPAFKSNTSPRLDAALVKLGEAVKVAKEHQSARQLRDARGRWRGTFFRRGETRPTFKGEFFS